MSDSASDSDTRGKLLIAGEKEFFEKGYHASSLRRICSEAGVTTGALYFFFRDKDDLFRSVISKVTVPFMEIIGSHYRSEADSRDDSQEADISATNMMIDVYFENRKACAILIQNRDTPVVKEFFRSFVDMSVRHYRKLCDRLCQIDPPDDFALGQFVHMQLDMIFTLAGQNFKREEMIMHSDVATRMLRGAFRALVAER